MNKSMLMFVYAVALLLGIAGLSGIVLVNNVRSAGDDAGDFLKNSSRFQKVNRQPISHFKDTFEQPMILEEAGSLSDSASTDWWVNSGGRFMAGFGTGHTIEGDDPPDDTWFQEYSRSNSQDTDGGKHPQNIFRIVQTDTWNNFSQHVYFQIDALNLSKSPNRAASNGVFLFNRYVTGDNLYYVGVRVDGTAVIKKKIDGIYFTMASTTVFNGSVYDRNSNPSLIPLHTWFGIRSDVVTMPDSSVLITFYIDKGSGWNEILQVRDDGAGYGGAPLIAPGYAGIRTDFMDVEFKNYEIGVI